VPQGEAQDCVSEIRHALGDDARNPRITEADRSLR
jgi:hypothetical protein